ncbi:MAG: DUF427 domain-containing protein [Deltaproteobacteria bacterium]|nr:DUF427 domain-containing protein [Deltaproteobacteria bacterium]
MVGLPEWARAARRRWRYRGGERPSFAIEPAPGQRSVWDFPRPPVIEEVPGEVRVRSGGFVIGATRHALRVLETASPPTYYLPRTDVDLPLLREDSHRSHCEWKGEAVYWNLAMPDETVILQVGWSYPDPYPEFAALTGHLSFYPGRVECFVGSERVRPQPGGFYGGWITSDLVGPFKGEPGVPGL